MSTGPHRSSDDESGPAPDSVRTRYDWAETDPVTAVVRTVAVATNRDPAALPPLYDTLDPEALRDLVTGSCDAGEADAGLHEVKFSYAQATVTLSADGTVDVRVRTDGRTPADDD